MTNQEREPLFEPEFAQLIDSIQAIKSPLTKFGETICTSDNFWLEPLYFHERVIVLMWVGSIEKSSQNALYEKDVKNFFNILNWLYSLEPIQATAEKPKKRKTEPILLNDESKDLIFGQTISCNEQSFVRGKNWEKIFLQMIRSHMLKLWKLTELDFKKTEEKLREQAIMA
jgi:hypothetical protein